MIKITKKEPPGPGERIAMFVLYLVVPCYNEEECLPESAALLKGKLQSLIEAKSIAPESRIVLVNDGSKDKTWSIISSLHEKDGTFVGIKLSRNKGHQYALMAGLRYAVDKSDATITIDADLQDDINAIDSMVDDFAKGNQIVYGVRTGRKSDSFFKRFTAESYYKFMRKIGVDMVEEAADFRLMGKVAAQALLSYGETNLFLRGVVPQIGYPSTTVGYERKPRTAGVSKYPLKKMLSLAWNGITSFSNKPLDLLFSCGSFLTFCSILVMIVFAFLYGFQVLPFWDFTYLIASLFLVCGILLQGMGILGGYIGKINTEVKKRPPYFIESILD
jgi:glycosyltransferase involved in cell wall biosynthesis